MSHELEIYFWEVLGVEILDMLEVRNLFEGCGFAGGIPEQGFEPSVERRTIVSDILQVVAKSLDVCRVEPHYSSKELHVEDGELLA